MLGHFGGEYASIRRHCITGRDRRSSGSCSAGQSGSACVSASDSRERCARKVVVHPDSERHGVCFRGRGELERVTAPDRGLSSSQLKATIDASDVSTAQTGWVTVTNPPPGGGTSNVVYLPVRKPSASVGMAISQPFPNATFVAAGDFNNDGKLDVGWYGNGGFNVSLGNGKGGFQAPILNTNVLGEEFVVGDFNG